MPYYTLQPASNTIETGSEYSQIQKMSADYNYKASNSVYALSKAVAKFPDFKPNLDYFILHGKAKQTDLLSVAPLSGGFLVSSKFKILLEKFKLAPHKFYPAKVYHKKEFHQYYWMHIICDLTEFVDYPNSIFFSYYNYTHNLGHIPIASKEDLKQKKEKIKSDNPDKTITIWTEKIILTSDFDNSVDLFEIGSFDNNYYISEQLMKAIASEKLTGCNIGKATNIEIYEGMQ